MARDDSKDSGLSWKQIGTILAGMIAISTLHASYVVPAIMTEVHKVVEERVAKLEQSTDRKMKEHLSHVHPGAVTQRELNLTIGNVNVKLETISDHLERIDKKLDK